VEYDRGLFERSNRDQKLIALAILAAAVALLTPVAEIAVRAFVVVLIGYCALVLVRLVNRRRGPPSAGLAPSWCGRALDRGGDRPGETP
jgi:hypothetical protein